MFIPEVCEYTACRGALFGSLDVQPLMERSTTVAGEISLLQRDISDLDVRTAKLEAELRTLW